MVCVWPGLPELKKVVVVPYVRQDDAFGNLKNGLVLVANYSLLLILNTLYFCITTVL